MFVNKTVITRCCSSRVVLLSVNSSKFGSRGFATSPAKRGVTGNAESIPALLDEKAKEWEGRDFLLAPFHQRLYRNSFTVFKERIDSFASGLIMGAKLKAGDQAITTVPNSPEHLITHFACGRLGLVWNPMDYYCSFDDLSHNLKDQRPSSFLFLNENRAKQLSKIIPELNFLPHGQAVRSREFPALRAIISTGREIYPGIGCFREIPVPVNPITKNKISPNLPGDSPYITINNTLYTQRQVMDVADGIMSELGLTEDDRVSFNVEMHEDIVHFAFIIGLFSQGSSVVVPELHFNPSALLLSISEERCTTLYLDSKNISALLQHPLDKYNLTSLKTVVVNGTPSAQEISGLKSTFSVGNIFSINSDKKVTKVH
eukprot:TRINITY_DN3547_c0_g1_i1.p1 TRINITY_DN3547_c0_g1~~TRINITY_DN3547_c0_g1_i1.p1  ORF type:complete len:373 (-),score=71.31 TRINITY_DN3547_c0_g1_i1:89-1207(-)